MSKDELEGEDVRQHRRVRRVWSAGVAALAVLAVVASLTGVWAVRNADRANDFAAEAGRQQRSAVEHQDSAQRFAEVAREQEEVAQQQEARAKQASGEAQRQEQIAQEQKGLAAQASGEAGRQQENARRQQGLASAAAVRAGEQERAARVHREAAQRSAVEAGRQKEIAQAQQRLAEEAAAVTRQQEEIAREQQRLAERATERAAKQEQIAQEMQQLAQQAKAEALKQQAYAEEQRRIAISRRLINQAKAVLGHDPKMALKLGLAAQKIGPDAQARRELTGLLTSTRYAGTINGVADGFAMNSNGVFAGRDLYGEVWLWGTTDRARPAQLVRLDRDRMAGALRFSPDGGTLAVAYTDHTVVLWDVRRPRDPAPRGTLPANAYALAFSPDGLTLATAGHSGVETLWNVADPTRPKPLATLPDGGPKDGDTITGGQIAFSSDGRTLVTKEVPYSYPFAPSPTPPRAAKVWNVTNRAKPSLIRDFDDPAMTPLAFSPVSPLLVATRDGVVTLVDMADPAEPRQRGVLTHHAGVVGSAQFSSDGRILATADDQGTATVWAVNEQLQAERLDSVKGHNVRGNWTALSPDGRTLVTEDHGIATLWNVQPYGAPQPVTELRGPEWELLDVAFTPDGRSMATADAMGTGMFWDMGNPARPRLRATTPIDPGSVESVAFTRDMRTVATASRSGVALWDVTDPTRPPVPLPGIEEPLDAPSRMALSPDGRTLAGIEPGVDGSGETVGLWDLSDRTRRPVRVGELAGSGAMAFSPDGGTLAVANRGETMTLWNVSNPARPEESGKLVGHTSSIKSVAFSPDGGTVATGGSDRATILWDISKPNRPHRVTTLTGHEGDVDRVAFADGHTVATSSDVDKTAMLWDIGDSGQTIRLATVKLNAHMRRTSYHAPMVFSPDGRTMAVGADGAYDIEPWDPHPTVKIWDYTTLKELRADPVKHACAIATAGLTADEWASYVPELSHEPTCPG